MQENVAFLLLAFDAKRGIKPETLARLLNRDFFVRNIIS